MLTAWYWMAYTKLELYGMGYSSTLDVRTIAEAECGVLKLRTECPLANVHSKVF